MTKARDIITNTLTFRLNKLSIGETLDADVAALCLAGLNEIVNAFNGEIPFLFREILTPGTVTGTSGTLGTTWPTLHTGDVILGASVSYQAGMDTPLDIGTMEQYQAIAQKATASIPQAIYPDGAATIYVWPAAAGQTITLRTRQNFSTFADLDTDYVMPDGFQAGFSAMLAELLAPSFVGGVTPAIENNARRARNDLAAQCLQPAIADAVQRTRGNILTGWR